MFGVCWFYSSEITSGSKLLQNPSCDRLLTVSSRPWRQQQLYKDIQTTVVMKVNQVELEEIVCHLSNATQIFATFSLEANIFNSINNSMSSKASCPRLLFKKSKVLAVLRSSEMKRLYDNNMLTVVAL